MSRKVFAAISLLLMKFNAYCKKKTTINSSQSQVTGKALIRTCNVIFGSTPLIFSWAGGRAGQARLAGNARIEHFLQAWLSGVKH